MARYGLISIRERMAAGDESDTARPLEGGEHSREPDLVGLGELERRTLLTWVGENLPEVRRTAYGQRPVYWILGTGFIVGLAAYIGGLRDQIVGDDGAPWVCGRHALHARLGTLDRCRRGHVPPGLSGGKAAAVQAGARCL
jgi:hypothetical protein